jgi:transcriptional regulator with XRE-family HTH domain
MFQDMSTQTLRLTLGASAREARLRLQLTQEDVAARLGMTAEVYGRIERGGVAPSVFTLRKLCLVLNLPADTALGLVSSAPPVEAEPPAPEPKKPEARYLDRIFRRARHLNSRSLRLMAQLVALLPRKSSGKPKRPRV